MEVGDDVVNGKGRRELESLLAWPVLARAPSVSRILTYICEQHFAGKAASIKEYNIAVEALGRPASFNPSADSIVRVEFCRLRKRLRQYYETIGASHRLRIELSETGYAPQFVTQPEHSDIEIGDGHNGFSASGVGAPSELKPDHPERGKAPVHGRSKSVLVVGILSLVFAVLFLFVLLRSGAHPLLVPNSAGSITSSQRQAARAPGLPAGPDTEIRICAGSSRPRYVDDMGRVWQNDMYFTGGVAISKPDRRISRTLDPVLYRSAREGDFRYDIPLRPGVYELRLHFAEIVYGDTDVGSYGEGSRRFTVTLNGATLLSGFDIVLNAAGPNTADQVVFKDVAPASDGFLHLGFISFVAKALLSGIEILPATPGKVRPVRIVCAQRMYYDNDSGLWETDRYFLGGRMTRRWSAVKGASDTGLYAGERWGSFTYAIPVAQGTYGVTLRFAESNFGGDNFGSVKYTEGGVGSRLFDVYCNGVVLLDKFDIFREAHGANRAIEKAFHGLRPNGQGKLLLSFVPVKDYPTVRAIEVIDESR